MFGGMRKSEEVWVNGLMGDAGTCLLKKYGGRHRMSDLTLAASHLKSPVAALPHVRPNPSPTPLFPSSPQDELGDKVWRRRGPRGVSVARRAANDEQGAHIVLHGTCTA